MRSVITRETGCSRSNRSRSCSRKRCGATKFTDQAGGPTCSLPLRDHRCLMPSEQHLSAVITREGLRQTFTVFGAGHVGAEFRSLLRGGTSVVGGYSVGGV